MARPAGCGVRDPDHQVVAGDRVRELCPTERRGASRQAHPLRDECRLDRAVVTRFDSIRPCARAIRHHGVQLAVDEVEGGPVVDGVA